MATLAVMKARIATELDRTNISSPIASAITDAIAEHERERFWFNESRDLTFSTVAAQRVYTTADATWIPDVIEIDDMFITVGGNNRRLSKDDPANMELLSGTTATTGAPYSWAYLNKSIQLYPIPDAVYTVRAVAHYRLAALSGDSDTNAWTTEAEQLIRRTAKLLLSVDLTGEGTGQMGTAMQASLDSLRAETSRRKTLGRVMATSF